MILQALHELYDRLDKDPSYELPRFGWATKQISFTIVLTPDGNLFEILDSRVQQEGIHRTSSVAVPFSGQRTSGVRPYFLCDNTEYMLGFCQEDRDLAKVRERFELFRTSHLKVEDEIPSPTYKAVCRFLREWIPDRCKDFSLLGEVSTGFGTFRIRGETRYVHEDPVIKDWWDRRTQTDAERMKQWWDTNKSAGKEETVMGQCLITGARAPIAQIHDLKVKGVRGKEQGDGVIVGFNRSSYCSYGFEQSYNAPVSVEAARRYVTALNSLLDGPMRSKHRVEVGCTTIAFWTEQPTVAEDVFAAFALHGSAAVEQAQDETLRSKLETFFRALRSGREAYGELAVEPDNTQFFVLGLSRPTKARIAVRFFQRTTVSKLIEALRTHFRDIEVECRPTWGQSSHQRFDFPAIRTLLDETVVWRGKNQRSTGASPRNEYEWLNWNEPEVRSRRAEPNRVEIVPGLEARVFESIINIRNYPHALFATTLRRVVIDRIVNYPRACIIKGYLVRNLGREVPVSLDTSRPEPAYRLGRLFAALEKTQQDALGGNLNATIRDRFYSSASATPAAVFPRLLRTYQHHLSKLDGGHKVNREKLVREILDPLQG
ncbi:MAG: type I-C CRISPR-associated protein Cas8c/Csd1, partial [Acidobacteria bacterium]|nr:type I-C CRISPR-associated protein Cas8c/Csd1 [Acidobacteriota bacterium]